MPAIDLNQLGYGVPGQMMQSGMQQSAYVMGLGQPGMVNPQMMQQ